MPDSIPWLIYLGVFFGPFVQEDAAVITAASLSVNEMAHWPVLFMVITAGLFFSDIWKYWIGWAALRNERAKTFVEKEKVTRLKDKVTRNLLATLYSARFIPLARVPTYIACGLFGVNYFKFCIYILLTALTYTTVIFCVFHIVGEVVGERLKWIIPIIGLSFAALYIGYLFFKSGRKAT